MQVNIEIKSRYAEKQGRAGDVIQQRLEQDEILVDGVRVGYVGTQLGARVTLITPVAESTMNQIKHQIDRRDQQGRQQRVVDQPQEIADE